MAATRESLMSVAISQIGTCERGNNIVKYNAEMWGNKSQGNPWCSTFVSWCARTAGIPQSQIVYTAGCKSGVAWFQKNNKFRLAPAQATPGYTPVPGDIIYFSKSCNINASSHTGIVIGVDNDHVYTVEGNSSNKVSVRKYKKTHSKIIGYGVWISTSTSVNHASEYASMKASGLKHDGYVGSAYSGGGSSSRSSSGGSGFGSSGGGSSRNTPSGTPRESYSANYGQLTGVTVYYNNVGPAPSAGMEEIETEVTDPSTGEVKVVKVMQEVYEPNVEEDPKEINDEDFSIVCEEDLELPPSDYSALESDEVEKFSGINFNSDGSYQQAEFKDPNKILKKFEAFNGVTTVLVMGFENPAQITFTADTLSSAISDPREILSQTGALQAVVNTKAAFDHYGKAIRTGCKCSVCGKNVPYMPVSGFCSLECFITDLTNRVLTHMKRDEANPINMILDKVSSILDYLNLVLNIITELPDMLRDLVYLPDAWKNYCLLSINIIFLNLRMIINKLMIKKNEYIIYLLQLIQRGVIDDKIKTVFLPIDTVINLVQTLQYSLQTAMTAALAAIKVPAIGISPESYAWLFTVRSMMNTDAGQLIIELPTHNMDGIATKIWPTGMINSACEKIDNVVKKTFPPIQAVEYFMDPALFDVRLALSDQSNVVKKFYETLEPLLVLGLDYMPRYKRLKLSNIWFVLAVLDGWAPHAKYEFGSIIHPEV